MTLVVMRYVSLYAYSFLPIAMGLVAIGVTWSVNAMLWTLAAYFAWRIYVSW